MRTGRDASGQRGSGTVLMAGTAVLLVAATAITICLVGWLGSIRRAAQVADLAALAGARAQVATGLLKAGPGCAVAAATVRANHAEMTSCSVDATEVDFVMAVTVRVEARPRVQIPQAPRFVHRTARAGPAAQR
ncbi:Rv3654c family TadE-like protein [Acidipropionibacterium jensenii]|uniref:Rv3654c family TadE-like protein n=1 Tax=Acidipropionibacterium jensenii TaxID=1749 RepID=UPI00214C3390